MKFTIALLSLLAASEAFQPAIVTHRPTTALGVSSRPDATELIKNAVAISQKFGKDSPEARLAWEVVEEVDASDNSVATKGSFEDECEIDDEWINRACMEYEAKLEELGRLMEEAKASVHPPTMEESVKPVKLPDVPQQKPAAQSAELQEALATAKSLTEKHGIQSSEARVAWETVEEIASASERNDALGGKLSADECLVDAALEACEAMEELHRVMDKRKN